MLRANELTPQPPMSFIWCHCAGMAGRSESDTTLSNTYSPLKPTKLSNTYSPLKPLIQRNSGGKSCALDLEQALLSTKPFSLFTVPPMLIISENFLPAFAAASLHPIFIFTTSHSHHHHPHHHPLCT